jgi:hypothetical protein
MYPTLVLTIRNCRVSKGHGTCAKLIVLGDKMNNAEVDQSCDGQQQRRHRSEASSDLGSSANVLPFVLAACNSLVSEIYTTTTAIPSSETKTFRQQMWPAEYILFYTSTTVLPRCQHCEGAFLQPPFAQPMVSTNLGSLCMCHGS